MHLISQSPNAQTSDLSLLTHSSSLPTHSSAQCNVDGPGERLQRLWLHFHVYEHLATSARQDKSQRRESPSNAVERKDVCIWEGRPFWGMVGQEMVRHSRESSVRNNQMQHQWTNPPSASINILVWHKERWVGERMQTCSRSLFAFRPWLLIETIWHEILVKWVEGVRAPWSGLNWPFVAFFPLKSTCTCKFEPKVEAPPLPWLLKSVWN